MLTVMACLHVHQAVLCSPMVLFTHNVKKIKCTTCKNGYIDGTCKRALMVFHCISRKGICSVHVVLWETEIVC